jgi:hypothetical protein
MSAGLVSECTSSGALLVASKPETLDGYKKLMDDLTTIVATKDIS